MQNTLVKVPIVFILCICFFNICFGVGVGVGVGGEGGGWVMGGGFRFHHYRQYITTTKPPESHEYLDCFTGLTASWT